MARGRSGRGSCVFLVVVFLLALAVGALAAFRAGPAPEISIEPKLPGIGKRTPISIAIVEPKRGLANVRVELVQGDRVEVLAERPNEPLAAWKFWGERAEREEMTLEVGSETIKGLKEGPATVRVVADRASSLLRHPDPAVEEVELEVRLRPPSIEVLSTQVYVSQGGSEVVVYRVGPGSARDGVQAGDWWFPGHALPGGDGRQRFALFAAPYDLGEPGRIRLIAADALGNEARSPFIERFTPRPFSSDTIELNEPFLSRVVPAILSNTTEVTEGGTLLESYLVINGELRKKNAATLRELSSKSAEEFLWSEEFVAPLRNGQVMSSFADRRSYVYDGRVVDRQDHLGFDLASTRGADVLASNGGIVVLARYFGIYGNAVVIDHGFGLMSLYGHLSSIEASEGQRVGRGDVVGRSGETGLAGGDHLHFTTMLYGLPVDPREWWDAHWIDHRLKRKLGPALPFQGRE